MKIISAESEIRIDRELDMVFAYFADLRNEPSWNRGHVRQVIMTSSEPIGPGTTFEGQHHGFGTTTWRITEYDPPSHILIDGVMGGAPYRYVGNLERDGNATIFHGCIEWEPHGMLRAFVLLLPLMLKFQTKRSFRNLRDTLQNN